MILQKNPITMVGKIDPCWLFTYQTPVEDALPYLPAPLELVTQNGCAFWNIVVCRVTSMRPLGAPELFGMDYWHIAYRLYVRYPVANGEPIEGLYFVRSDCDKATMALAGNIVTDYHFHTAAVDVHRGRHTAEIDVRTAGACVHASIRSNRPADLAPYSAFRTLDQAAAFLKYKPYGISVNRDGSGSIVRIVRDESAWCAHLVRVVSAEFTFMADKHARPEICYEVDPIEYRWNRAYRVLSTEAVEGVPRALQRV